LLFTKELLFFLKDVFDLSHSSIFDEGAFQVYQTVGRSIVARIIELRRSESLASQMAHELNLKLNTFNSSWQLYSGVRMEQLWHTFRPAVASSLSQLKYGLQLRELAERFDALKWSSGASVQELDMLRDSIVRMHNTITNSWQEVGPLKVDLPLHNIETFTDNLAGCTKECRATHHQPRFVAECNCSLLPISIRNIVPV
jgi:midasin